MRTELLYTLEEWRGQGRDDVVDRIFERQVGLNVEHDWYQLQLANWKEELLHYGFTGVDIEFTGFGSQVGVGFTASAFDPEQFVRRSVVATDQGGTLFRLGLTAWRRYLLRVLKAVGWEGSVERTRDFGGFGVRWAFSVNLAFTLGRYPPAWARPKYAKAAKVIEWWQEGLEEWRLSFCRMIYGGLEEEYDSLCGKDAISDTCAANDYHFDVWGELR